TIAAAAAKADCAPDEWKAAEAGKALLPARSLWLLAVRVSGSVEWLLTGECNVRRMPDPLPEIGIDLTGFAARLKAARERLGITADDIALAGDSPRYSAIVPHWPDWEAGLDEPEYAYIP